MASELMRSCVALRRPRLSLQRRQEGTWGAVVKEGECHFKPAEQRAEARVVEGGREQHEVRHALHRLRRHPLLHRRGDLLEQPLGRVRARHLHHADALGGEEDGVEGVERQLPAQAGRQLVRREVERQLLAQRPVELTLEPVG